MSDIEINYPAPVIPLSPVLSRFIREKLTGEHSTPPSILDAPHQLHVSSGRAGIALALEHAGVTEGDEVLIPAYHCESMVAPVTRAGATPVFYRVNLDTRIDVADITYKITANTKAILATHYFGFPQNLEPLVKICADRGLALIEDCAHTFFGCSNSVPVGQIGDYAIASSMKFFPVYDGGMLVSRDRDLSNVALTTPPIGFQLKSLFNILEKAIGYRRLGMPGKLLNLLLSLKNMIWSAAKSVSQRSQPAISSGPSSADGGYGLDEVWIHKSISWPSKKIIENTNLNQLVEARRDHYDQLIQGLQNTAGCHPLHPSLPPGITPLVCPIYVDEPEQHFENLKKIGVPIWRFGEFLDPAVDENLCANSVELSAHIFQFPCHQELTNEEIEWMIRAINREFEN